MLTVKHHYDIKSYLTLLMLNYKHRVKLRALPEVILYLCFVGEIP